MKTTVVLLFAIGMMAGIISGFFAGMIRLLKKSYLRVKIGGVRCNAFFN